MQAPPQPAKKPKAQPKPPREPQIAIMGLEPLIPFSSQPSHFASAFRPPTAANDIANTQFDPIAAAAALTPTPAAPSALPQAAAELLLSRHMQQGFGGLPGGNVVPKTEDENGAGPSQNANAAGAAAPAPALGGTPDSAPPAEGEAAGAGALAGMPGTPGMEFAAPAVAPPAPENMIDYGEAGETSTKYTGVRKNKGGRFSARIKISGTNKCAPLVHWARTVLKHL